MSAPPRLAVLIDAENVGAWCAPVLFAAIDRLGRADIRRIYGDFSTPVLRPWVGVMSANGLVPQQHFNRNAGKNGADIAMVIDAMDLLYTQRPDGFCLVSSDGDFSRLAARLREAGARVFGFGEAKAPLSFRHCCERFFVLNGPPAEAEDSQAAAPVKPVAAKPTAPSKPAAPVAKAAPAAAPKPAPLKPAAAVQPAAAKPVVAKIGADKVILAALAKADATADGWVRLSAVGSTVMRLQPDFDARHYGHKRLSDLVRALPGIEVAHSGAMLAIRPRAGTINGKG